MMAKKAAPKIDKHDALGRLLTDYGLEVITPTDFAAQMAHHKFTQADVDEWCAENHRRSEHEREGEDRPARTAVAEPARGASGASGIKVRQTQSEGGRRQAGDDQGEQAR
jgi:hypothetical protein